MGISLRSLVADVVTADPARINPIVDWSITLFDINGVSLTMAAIPTAQGFLTVNLTYRPRGQAE